jgi:putative membrane protein insertion efficiency factor
VNAFRHALRRAGAPLRWALTTAIRGYQATLSGWLGGQCRFAPTCSQYAIEAIDSFGAVRGLGMATWRILRCNPYGKGGLDPVPERHGSCSSYDIITQGVNPEGSRTGADDAARGAVA